MRWLTELAFVVRKLDRRRAERELAEEIRAHFEMEVERNLERGMSPEEARRAAHVAFGSVSLAGEDSRREWGFAPLETLLRDVAYGARLLRRAPGFTLVAAGTLALGIGATTAVYSVVNGVLLRQLPFAEPERVVTLWEHNVKDGIERDDVSPANFLDWRERSTAFEAMAYANPHSLDYGDAGEPETLSAALVSERFFDVLGTAPLHGRTFLPEEYEPGRGAVVLMSHELWASRFGSDPGVVGSKVVLDEQPFTVVGVLPRDFRPGLFERETLLWAPQAPSEQMRKQRRATYLKVVARLAPGVTVEQASSEMDSIAAQLAAELPQTNSGVGVATVPLPEHLAGRVRPGLLLLFGAATFVLLVACVNVANLTLARANAREREFAVRAAIGASRSRLLQQALVESLLVAAIGCAGGAAVAWAGLRVLLALGPESIPRLDLVELDTSALAFAAAVGAATALAFGLAPALQLSRPDVNSAMKEASPTTAGHRSRTRLRSALVVTEIALAFVLLVGAGLLARSFARILEVDPGFAADRVAALQVFIWDRYRTPEARAQYVAAAVERLQATPGVEAVGVTTALPFLESSQDSSFPFVVEGQPPPPSGAEPTAFATIATPEYFEVIGVPLLAGRLFDGRDTASSAPVVIVNETMARRNWPGEDPVGRRFRVGTSSRDGRGPTLFEVVGVVGDARHEGLDKEPRPEFFRPYTQSATGSLILAVRTSSNPAALVPTLKARLWEVNATQPFYAVAVAEDLISDSLKARRFSLALVGLFAALALALSVVGIFGLTSYVTRQRTREIGIRIACGARAADIVRLVLGQGARLAAAGIALGGLGALALTRLLASQLFGVEPYDAVTFAAVALALFAVTVAACLLPAWRATGTDALEALRHL